MSADPKGIKRSILYVVSIIAIMLILSIITLIQAFKTYMESGRMDFLALFLSASAFALSIYMALQIGVKPPKLGFEQQKVLTVIRCSRCGFESVRNFKEGDYVLKKIGSCPKCNGPSFIYMIFREEEKGKKKAGKD